MRYMKWFGLMAVILMVVSCFTPWVIIESKNIVISGVDSGSTNFGKPAYLHFIFSFFFLLFHLIPTLWAKRWNLVVVALNLAWAIRNFIIISACRDGECPLKKTGLYLMLTAAMFMLLSALFPDVELPENKKE